MAAGTPCPGLCRVEIVDPGGGALPGEPGDRGHLVAGLKGGRGHGDHRECRDPQERSQQAVGVIVPGRGPGDVENMPELADPFPVRRTQANRFFPGKQVVFGEPIRAFRGAIGIEDAIDIEQQSWARHLSSMDAASCGGSRAAQRRGRCGRGCDGVHKPHQTLPRCAQTQVKARMAAAVLGTSSRPRSRRAGGAAGRPHGLAHRGAGRRTMSWLSPPRMPGQSRIPGRSLLLRLQARGRRRSSRRGRTAWPDTRRRGHACVASGWLLGRGQ